MLENIDKGDVAVICGGPTCEGISGYNRFRNFDSPLDDERNHQILIFMDIIDFIRPKFVLMENVVDRHLEVCQWLSGNICYKPSGKHALPSKGWDYGCWLLWASLIPLMSFCMGCSSS